MLLALLLVSLSTPAAEKLSVGAAANLIYALDALTAEFQRVEVVVSPYNPD